MATDNEYQDVVEAVVVADTELQRMIDFPAGEIEDALAQLIHSDNVAASFSSFAIGLDGIGITTGGATGAPSTLRASVSAGALKLVGGWIVDQMVEVNTGGGGHGGFLLVPFDDNTAATYYVGLITNDFPIAATAQAQITGAFVYDTMARGVGEQVTPSLVTVNPGGAGSGIRFTIATTKVPPWNNAAHTRPATVWMVSPVTAAADAIFNGALSLVGGVLVLDTGAGNYLGQPEATASAVGADYVLQVHGLTITKDVLTTIFGTFGRQAYLTLATIAAAGPTVDRTIQNVVPSFIELGLGTSAFLALQQATRAGARLGSSEETRDWTDPSNVVSVTGGGFHTFTFGDPFAGIDRGYIYTGSQVTGVEPTICDAFAAGGLVASLVDTAPDDTYYILAERVVAPSLVATSDVELTVVTDAVFAAGGDGWVRRILWVYQFDIVAGAIANEVGRNLNEYRGFLDGGSFASDGSWDGLRAVLQDCDMTDDAFTIWGSDTPTAATFTQSVAMSLRRRPDGSGFAHTSLELPGVNGDLDDALVTGATEISGIRLGGPNDYRLLAVRDGTAARWFEILYTGGAQALQHQRVGGFGSSGTGRTLHEDVHISSTGKLVWKSIDIAQGFGDANWTYVHSHAVDGAWLAGGESCWETGNAAENILHLPIPLTSLENTAVATVEQVRIGVMARAGLGNLDGFTVNLYSQQFVESAPITNPPTITKTLRATAFQGTGVGVSMATVMVLTPGAPAVLARDTRLFVEVINETDDGGCSSYRVFSLEVKMNIGEIT